MPTDPTPHGLLSWIPFLGTSATAREQYHQQLDLMVKRLKKLCVKTIKVLESHNYEVKYSPNLRCYHPNCQLCFFTEEQYHRHILMADTAPHRIEKESLYPEQKQWMEALLQEIKQKILQARDRVKPSQPSNLDPPSSSQPPSIKDVTEFTSLLDPLQDLALTASNDSSNSSYEIETLEDHFPLLHKYALARTSTHFHLLLRNIKGVEWFRQYYLQQYGLGRIVNTLDCYLAIQEWKKYTTVQSQYYTKAISIYEMYLQEDAVRAIEVVPVQYGSSSSIAISNLQLLLSKLSQLKEEDRQAFPGFYSEAVKKLTSFQVLFGVKASSYTQWTVEKLFLPTLFQEFEAYLFAVLFTTFRLDRGFFLSPEYYQYLVLLEKEVVQKEEQLFQDYHEYRTNIISNWSISFRQYELLISQKADQILEKVIHNQIEEIYLPIERYTVRERGVEKRHVEQQQYEEEMLLIDEAIHYTADNTAEFVFSFYVSALIKAMWEVPDYRKGMLQYSGYAKFKLKKKNDVMANYEAMMSNKEKVQESKEWFNQFFKSTATQERSLLPKDADTSWRQKQPKAIPKFESIQKASADHIQATVMIQRRLRGLLARKSARKEFAKTYKKYYDDTAKAHYYFNTTTQESTWTPPKLFQRLYPKSKW